MSYQGTSYKGRDWMIGWKISTGEMVVGPYPDLTRWANGYESTTGCCFTEIHTLTDEEIAECLRGEALHMISLGVPVETGFREFSKIRIWRDMRMRTTAGAYFAFYEPVGYERMNPYNPYPPPRMRFKAPDISAPT